MKEKRVRINSPAAIGRATDACLSFDLKSESPAITQSDLDLIRREDDLFTPIHLAEQIHKNIPNSEWKILEEVGHNLYIEKADEMARVVLDFLNRLEILNK